MKVCEEAPEDVAWCVSMTALCHFLKDDLGALQALERLPVPAEAAQCCAWLDYRRYKARVWFAEVLSLHKSLGLRVGAQTTRHKCLV